MLILCPGCANQLKPTEYRTRYTESKDRGTTVYTCRICTKRFTVHYDKEINMFVGQLIDNKDNEIIDEGIEKLMPTLKSMKYHKIDALLSLTIMHVGGVSAKEAVSAYRTLLATIDDKESKLNKYMTKQGKYIHNANGEIEKYWTIIKILKDAVNSGVLTQNKLKDMFGTQHSHALEVLIMSDRDLASKAVEKLQADA